MSEQLALAIDTERDYTPKEARKRYPAPDPESPVHRWRLDPRNPDRCRECQPYPAVARVACPVCGAGPGEPCLGKNGGFGASTEMEPWASDPWGTAHGQRHGILSALRNGEDEHDPEFIGHVLAAQHWAVAWLHGNDEPIARLRESGKVAKGHRRRKRKRG